MVSYTVIGPERNLRLYLYFYDSCRGFQDGGQVEFSILSMYNLNTKMEGCTCGRD